MLFEVYLITMPDIVIDTFAALFVIFWKYQRECMKKNNGYKYEWNQSNKHTNNCCIEHLFTVFLIPSS